MTVSGLRLLLGTISKSMALQLLGSMLMFIALVTNESYADDQGHVGICGSWCHWGHTNPDDLCSYPGQR